jgi:hypothetical protein
MLLAYAPHVTLSALFILEKYPELRSVACFIDTPLPQTGSCDIGVRMLMESSLRRTRARRFSP